MECNSDYEAKINEALLIKHHGPNLDKQCYASGAPFLLNIYKQFFYNYFSYFT